jgi:hypothetical protein
MDNVTVQVQFDKESYEMSGTAVLNITDVNGNIDPDVVNYVFVDIQSNSSAPDILRLVLEETGTDTGIFTGSFTFSNFITTDEPPILRAAVGDQLFVFYTQGTRFQASVSNATESSMLQMQDALPETPTNFIPIGGAVDLQLVDTDIFGNQTTINVTMSYANALLFGNDPSDLTIFQFREGVWTNMTDLTTVSVDTGAKTVSTGAVVAKPGVFTLAFDGSLPGGGGGGLPRPGTGIVLDSVVSIAATVNDDSEDNSDDENNGGGGGGRRVVVVSNDPAPEAQSISTFSDAHFDDRPLDRIEINQAEFLDANDNRVSEAAVGQQVSITGTFSNHQQGPQKYSFIVLVIDDEGFAVDIMLQEGVVEGGQSADLSVSWTPQDAGTFTIKMFVWDGFDNPSPLSQVLTNNIPAA